jgi:CxC2 like cysteine cluster associated with KDZ transposases
MWQEWSGSYFICRALKDLGLHVQLGHPIGERCCKPWSVPKDEFVILHSNGIHMVCLSFCRCKTAETYSWQLLRIHWFPVTSDKPHTAATFQVLENFHLLSLESKLSCYEFYNVLSHCSDNTGLNSPKVCHNPLFQLCILSHVRLIMNNFW